ncbi:MAG TPA: F0F1 ATP synthase subunit alpha [Candidatus Angelobacter sp.]|jgi:F-type H+-transporting ATPase subunit alpha|nr:F0F1 ATP synthase subunit alpha [Candidatus Angelobacter sp.]
MSEIKPSEISELIKHRISELSSNIEYSESGFVFQNGDSVARVFGLEKVCSGELVQFHTGIKGIVLNLEEDYVSVVFLGPSDNIREGDIVKRSGRLASIYVGEGMLGRVVNALGNPIDGKGPIQGKLFELPLERKAPGVIFRQPVNEPLHTGIKAIDIMVPIGRGQRQLIVGDRQTGKTTLAIDTILNQKRLYESSNPIYCIYVAISQKGSSVAGILKTLREHGALSYTVLVVASAADPAPMQIFAPFAGTSIGEFFRDMGKSALIIYDDLSKQAVSYREVSLLLNRPPGREAYPGDVFYLHSRLLERSAKIIEDDVLARQMNDLPDSLKKFVKGGGSLTALPIVETQYGDVSSYIPTNVISITDGQIFLESDLFNAGVRPAINEGISVSRVGGEAQIASMKKLSGTFKLDQSQFRELEGFSKFSSDLDTTTISLIHKGRCNVELLNQAINSPYKISDQIALVYASTKNLLKDIPVNKVKDFEKEYLSYLNNQHSEVISGLEKGILNDKFTDVLEKIALQLSIKYKHS